ncbi:helix-turn-helix domain-containing protein [Chitinophaga sp. SYP-B3965]|uniref:helix-turn-helix transcriptional regulator n=1 Tax=Chitinophaga sp. SYP-B3965 TaxID=2663120 RepID=UPI001299E02A|nr:helix-turn-helix transcriptional regulator [Chitinophaga sp. SYP-B3965]MRG45485.1 helix-turn-helix domain-containing protein [Chitinophaga sp. SYP-B3965]
MEKVHLGNNVKNLRETLHIKQSVIADALNISQQAVSLLEAKEEIDKETLELIASALNVPVEAIENFNLSKAIQIIATSFQNTNHDNSAFYQNQPTFQVVDKTFDLYERMLREKDIEKLKLEAECERLRNERAAKEADILRLQTELERLRKGK